MGEAVAYAAEPVNMKYMRKQLWRWKSGFFQNVRQHGWSLIRRKQLLAIWVLVALLETLMSPVMMALPMWWLFGLHDSPLTVAGWWVLSETLLFAPATIYAWVKRRTNPLRVLANYPAFYVLKMLNFYYDWKAICTELIGYPLGLTEGLHDYEKGRADTGESPHKKSTIFKARGRHRLTPEFSEADTVSLAVLMDAGSSR